MVNKKKFACIFVLTNQDKQKSLGLIIVSFEKKYIQEKDISKHNSDLMCLSMSFELKLNFMKICVHLFFSINLKFDIEEITFLINKK